MPTEQEIGGLIGVELGMVYDSRELEQLSGAKYSMSFLLNLNHDLSQTANRVVYWHVDFLFGFFPLKRVDVLALVG